MKPVRSILPFALSFLVGLMVLSGCATVGGKNSAGVSSTQEQAGGAHIKSVALEKMKGKERISILLSDAPDFGISKESDNALVINFKGVSVPGEMKKEYGGEGLRNLEGLTLYQKTTAKGNEAYARVLLKKMVPYRYRKDGTKVVVDFDVSTLSYAAATPKAKPASAARATEISPREVDPQTEKAGQYTGVKMTLDFQDTDIKSVFRLISEISGFSIVAGPGVKAEVTAHMKNIPWDQALDTILEVNGLGKKKSGKVITVLPLEELKKAEEEQQKKDVTQGTLRQISIEAKIVEVTTSFSRKLGIQWGAGYKAGSFAMGIGSSSSGDVTPIPGGGGIGFTNSNVAVNFPSLTAVTAPVIGMVLGTSKMILDAQLQAMEANGDGKIISSPKITTLDGVKATIKQWEQVPYPVYDEGVKTIEFKDAVLQLDAKPMITSDGRISMEIRATNDYADWQSTAEGVRIDNPPIVTNSVESTVVVRDGDTIVVGGIYKTIETDGTSGVPWFSKIPVLGWLFKTESKTKQKRELLIFVTPRIIED